MVILETVTIGKENYYMKRKLMTTNQKKLHIAMIGQKRVPSREGGVEVVVWELATRLRDRDYDVDCYNRSGYHLSAKDYGRIPGKKGVYEDGIRILTIPTFRNGKLNAVVYSFFATIRALFGKYDVIHFHAEGPCLMIWIPKLFGIRAIATIHGLDWQRAKWGKFAAHMLKSGEKMAAKHADEVIVLSKCMQKYFKDKYGRDTLYIPNGIDKPKLLSPNIISKKYGLSKDSYILILCRIVPEKGIHYLLDAYKEIKCDKKLVIAGGFSNAKEYVEIVEQKASEDGRVIQTGFVEGDELVELLSNAYIYCLPSDVEGMSISLLEAMSYGNCCLISDIEENLEVTEGDQYADVFMHGDVEDLREELEKLILHPELVENYKKNSAEYICDKYNWDKMTDDTEKVYYGK